MKNFLLVLFSLCAYSSVNAASQKDAMKEDKAHVQNWNKFALALHKIHLYYLTKHKTYTTERIGGYASKPKFYKEISYYDSASKRLLSRIQWVIQHPKRMHTVEIYIYDKKGKLVRDYLAAYLPHFRNAPIQTLINLHARDDRLKAWRQFDASGNRIYEQCKGTFFGHEVNIKLTDDEMVAVSGSRPAVMNSDSYIECFSGISASASPYLNPLNEIKFAKGQQVGSNVSDKQVLELTRKITKQPHAGLLVKRGNLYFKLHQFDKAIADFSRAIKMDVKQDQAWFGRGMARGRAGKVLDGIKDLTVYIRRNKNSSLAYTKRGVRYIWAGKLKKAERDLRKAVQLNPNNAEAFDDLGVLVANKKDYPQAIRFFKRSVKIDSSYLKAHHNMAMAYHLSGDPGKALLAVDAALRLKHNAKNTLLLKAVVLDSIGKKVEAQKIRDNAAFMTGNNWSEVMKVR